MNSADALLKTKIANGLEVIFANIHNATKARTPMVNIARDHATYHLKYDPPLTSYLDGLAKASSDWAGRSNSPDVLNSRGPSLIEVII